MIIYPLLPSRCWEVFHLPTLYAQGKEKVKHHRPLSAEKKRHYAEKDNMKGFPFFLSLFPGKSVMSSVLSVFRPANVT